MILSVQPEATLTIPLSLIFWCNVVVYIFHIFEESVLGEVFVMKVRRLYFHAYEWKYFAGTFFIWPLQVKLNRVFEKQGRKIKSLSALLRLDAAQDPAISREIRSVSAELAVSAIENRER